VVDLLARLGTKFHFEDLEAERVEIEGIPVIVATPATLVRMKRGTLRPIDQADAAELRRKFRIEDAAAVSLERFRSFDEARRALVDRDDPELAARIRRLWAFASRLSPVAGPRGLRRFRTIGEANRERDERTRRRVESLRRARDTR